MPNIIEITDFTGAYSISTDEFTEVEFEVIRDDEQFAVIYDMLGAELGQLFIDDLDSSGIPQEARFTSLYEAFKTDYCGAIIKSEGIKAMVKYDLYFKIVRDNNITVAITGNLKSEGENSSPEQSTAWLVRTYNRMIDTAQAIQWFICQNSADYPEYNGQEMEFIPLF